MPKFFVRETFSVSLFPGTEKVYIKEGGVSRFSVGTLLSHSTEKLHRGILLCFRKYLVSKKFKEERGRESQDFPSKIFCLAVPKNFVGEYFSASLISVVEKFYASERWSGYRDFPSIFFCLTVPKISLGVMFQCFNNFGVSKNFMPQRGGREYRDFPSKFFCLTVPRNSVGGNRLVFH